MFSKKAMWITLVSLLAQLIYMNLGAIPPHLIKPLLIIGAVGLAIGIYAYSQGWLDEQKVIEKIAEHTDDPLAHIRERTEAEKEMIAQYEARRKKSSPPKMVSGDAVPM